MYWCTLVLLCVACQCWLFLWAVSEYSVYAKDLRLANWQVIKNAVIYPLSHFCVTFAFLTSSLPSKCLSISRVRLTTPYLFSDIVGSSGHIPFSNSFTRLKFNGRVEANSKVNFCLSLGCPRTLYRHWRHGILVLWFLRMTQTIDNTEKYQSYMLTILYICLFPEESLMGI